MSETAENLLITKMNETTRKKKEYTQAAVLFIHNDDNDLYEIFVFIHNSLKRTTKPTQTLRKSCWARATFYFLFNTALFSIFSVRTHAKHFQSFQ